MDLLINDRRYRSSSDPARMLLWVLRDELDLTSAKYGCGEGQCGACTVLLDGVAVRSCITPLKDAVGKKITTIEGMERDGQLHPVQEAFIKADAMQCGYCTPGMILASVSVLEKNPHPDEGAIRHGLQGNICRCGTYPRIVAAVRMAAQAMSAKNANGGRHA